MNTIIVSVEVTIDSKKYLYDMEVPVNQRSVELSQDIVEAVHENIKEKAQVDTNDKVTNKVTNKKNYSIYIKKTGRILGDNETLGKAGVRNGDYLRIDEREWC